MSRWIPRWREALASAMEDGRSRSEILDDWTKDRPHFDGGGPHRYEGAVGRGRLCTYCCRPEDFVLPTPGKREPVKLARTLLTEFALERDVERNDYERLALDLAALYYATTEEAAFAEAEVERLEQKIEKLETDLTEADTAREEAEESVKASEQVATDRDFLLGLLGMTEDDLEWERPHIELTGKRPVRHVGGPAARIDPVALGNKVHRELEEWFTKQPPTRKRGRKRP